MKSVKLTCAPQHNAPTVGTTPPDGAKVGAGGTALPPSSGIQTVANQRQQHWKYQALMLTATLHERSNTMAIQYRIMILLIASGLGLGATAVAAAELHISHFLSPRGQVVATTQLTADCHYRDTTGIHRLQQKHGNTGRVTCSTANGIPVATFAPQELHAENLRQQTHGGIVLTMGDGRRWHSHTRSTPASPNAKGSSARYACSPCVPTMPSICCPRRGA